MDAYFFYFSVIFLLRLVFFSYFRLPVFGMENIIVHGCDETL